MLRLAIPRIRLRLSQFKCGGRFHSTLTPPATVKLRLADKEHRSHFRSLESEARKFKKGKLISEFSLKPSMRDFLVWLHLKNEGKIHNAKLGNPVIPSPLKISAVTEIGMFHLLTGVYSEDLKSIWFMKLNQHLDALLARIENNRKFKSRHTHDLKAIFEELGTESQSESLKEIVISKALTCIAYENSATESNIVAWVKSLTSASVTQACHELANLSNIPAFVTSDILLRTPMTKDELYLQLDVWNTFMHSIGQAYYDKTSHTSSIIHNLAYYSIQFDPYLLPELISITVQYFTSTKSGFNHKLIDNQFVNHLIYSLAYYYIRSSIGSVSAAMTVIKAQEHLVQLIGHSNLSQEGYIGVVLAISQVSEDKAQKLFQICQTHLHEYSTYLCIGSIYLSTTPEQLLHNFNSAVARFPSSATMWLVFVKKLQSLELLTESRAQKLLKELVSRKNSLIISKDVILTLLHPIESINGIEAFIKTLEEADLFQMFKNVVMSKYLNLLYRFSNEKNVRKPYFDKLLRSSTNIDCARYLFKNTDRKTTAMIGIMLNGEVSHQPQKIYNMYIEELKGRLADEHCLMALLRACKKKFKGQVIMWGQLYAPQVAVHEFKKHVAKTVLSPLINDSGVIPSNKLWKTYIQVLSSSKYIAELAEVMRWWEQLLFVPSRSTLRMLLNALPREFAERHIKHANAVPRNASTVPEWPWPTLEEFRNL